MQQRKGNCYETLVFTKYTEKPVDVNKNKR